ncbi:MAG: hypothetical protein AB2A00_15095 [Myxococcota bacterium]
MHRVLPIRLRRRCGTRNHDVLVLELIVGDRDLFQLGVGFLQLLRVRELVVQQRVVLRGQLEQRDDVQYIQQQRWQHQLRSHFEQLHLGNVPIDLEQLRLGCDHVSIDVEQFRLGGDGIHVHGEQLLVGREHFLGGVDLLQRREPGRRGGGRRRYRGGCGLPG